MMSITSYIDPDFEDFFQNLDSDDSWLEDPTFKWSSEDLFEFEREEELAKMERLAMAAWWEDEGVRCWTFGKPRNPYHVEDDFN